LFALAAVSNIGVTAQVNGNDNNIAMIDDCRPDAWPPNACDQDAHGSDVSQMEFQQLLRSPLIPVGFVGHPSWRNEPSHITASAGRAIRVTNMGGRGHSLTEVANFGGGSVAGFNNGTVRAPECAETPAGVAGIPPGGSDIVTDLAPGLHKFQCCFHPWMRATIRIE
jgi:plastocyanin